MHFTDDMTQVPEKYQGTVKSKTMEESRPTAKKIDISKVFAENLSNKLKILSEMIEEIEHSLSNLGMPLEDHLSKD